MSKKVGVLIVEAKGAVVIVHARIVAYRRTKSDGGDESGISKIVRTCSHFEPNGARES